MLIAPKGFNMETAYHPGTQIRSETGGKMKQGYQLFFAMLLNAKLQVF